MEQSFGRISMSGFLLLMSLFGCSTRESVSLPSASSPLVGRWRQTSIATGNQSAKCPATMPLPGGSTTSCSGNDMIEFDPNGTFTATFSGSSVKGSGTWRLTGNNLALTFTAPPNVAGRSQSATIRFGEGGKTININSKLGETRTTETYTRQ
ncbi:MAG TPA: lipocalin family protein [Candidatus Binatia bacterium]